MIKILERFHETAGLDEQTRTRYAISALFYREGRTSLGALFRYWNGLRRDVDELPRVENFRPEEDPAARTGPPFSWVDTRAASPTEYILQNHPPSPIPGFGIELSTKPVTAVPSSIHAQACMMEYLSCKHAREPMYHEIQQIIRGTARHYTRLLVPVADDQDQVVRLYYAVRIVRHAPFRADGPAQVD